LKLHIQNLSIFFYFEVINTFLFSRQFIFCSTT